MIRTLREGGKGGLQLLRQDKENDLAVIVVDSKTLSNKNLYPAVPLTKSCPKKKVENYIIGYPKMEMRYNNQPWMHLKRWSQGHQSISWNRKENKETEYGVLKIKNGKKQWVPYHIDQSSADSLSGNSGGPSFNKKGEVIGVLVGGAIGPDFGVKTNGYIKKKLNHSNIADCEAMLRITRNIPNREFLPKGKTNFDGNLETSLIQVSN